MRLTSLGAVALVCFSTSGLAVAAAQKAEPPSNTTGSGSNVTEVEGKNLQEWIKQLRDRDPAARVIAVQAVMRFGEAGQEAGPELIARLKDPDASVRMNAVTTIAAIGVRPDDVKNAVLGLADRLSDQQGLIRIQACVALAAFGEKAKPAIPELSRRVQDLSTFEVRKMAVLALSKAAADPLNGPDMKAISAILYVLGNDHSAQVRQAAAMALGQLGRPAELKDYQNVRFYLMRALGDHDKTVVIWTYVALLMMDDAVNEDHLTAIAKLMNPRSKAEVRVHAARALGAIGRKARSKIPDLIAALKDPEPQVATSAGWSLAQMGDLGGRDLNRVAELLKDEEWQARVAAAQSLGMMGKNAAGVAPDLIRALEDPNIQVVTAAAWALSQVGDLRDGDLAAIGKLLHHSEAVVRTQAAQTLGLFGEKAKSRVNDLLLVLDDKEVIVAAAAVWALGQMGDAATPAVPSLTTLLQKRDLDPALKTSVTEALDKIKRPRR